MAPGRRFSRNPPSANYLAGRFAWIARSRLPVFPILHSFHPTNATNECLHPLFSTLFLLFFSASASHNAYLFFSREIGGGMDDIWYDWLEFFLLMTRCFSFFFGFSLSGFYYEEGRLLSISKKVDGIRFLCWWLLYTACFVVITFKE